MDILETPSSIEIIIINASCLLSVIHNEVIQMYEVPEFEVKQMNDISKLLQGKDTLREALQTLAEEQQSRRDQPNEMLIFKKNPGSTYLDIREVKIDYMIASGRIDSGGNQNNLLVPLNSAGIYSVMFLGE